MTITFQHEWTGENGGLRAIPHITTKNSSFLRTAQLLKRMGIANYAFALSLYDPDLKDVDVYNLEENTPDNEILRTKVMIEARRNGWYYLRECVRIYEQGGSPVPFRLDRGSCAMAWCFFNGLDYCGMQPRQTGKASRTDSLILTTEGWRRMGDIKIGDFVVTPDGGTAPVIGVYPQGMKDIHRVYFEDGRWTDCCEEHLWKVYHSHWEPADDRWRVVELRDIIEHRRLHPTSESGFSVPLLVPQEKPDIDLPIDPYVLGAILGDGHINEKFVQFASADQFIVDEINQLLPDDYELVHCSRVQYSIRRKSSGKWGEKVSVFRASSSVEAEQHSEPH